MKKSFVLIGILLIIGTICAGMEVQASTSSELYESTDAYYNYQKYSNNYETPYSANLENNITIDEMTGSLRLQETDISLPGKNGLDVNITRIYNNSDTGYKLNSKNDNKTSTYLGYLYESEAGYMYVYFDEEKYIDGAPVSFMAPRDISGHVWSANNIDKYGKSTAVSYDMIMHIQPKSSEKIVEYTKCSDNAVIFNGVNMGSFQDMGEFKLGNNFKLAWPRIVFDSTGKAGEFENENGEVFSFSLGDKTYDPEINEYDGRCFGKTGSDTTILRHKIEKFFKKERVYKGVTYTERVKDIDGKTYYFYQEDNSKISKIRLIEDIYGNTILYTYDEIGNVTITDTYGRKIKISRINLDTINGNDYGESYTNMETRVSIENGDAKQEVLYKTYVESNNNNKIYDDKYIFEVKKKEAYDQFSADNSDCVTRYEMTRKQMSVHECLYGSDDGRVFDSIVSKHIPVLRLRGKDTYNIDKIVYPTGAYSLYEYSDDVKLNETEYVDYFIKASKVLSSKEILKDGICKNEYNYSYKSQADFTKYDLYNITTNTTEIKDALGTVKTVNYKGDNGTYRTVFEIQSKDSSGQIINDEKYTLQSSGVTFSKNIGNYSKGNTECKTKKVETNYFRDWGNMLLSESVGNRKTNYEYALVKPDGDVSYDYMGSIIGLRSVVNRIPELTTYKKDSDTTIKIENVFGTMDGTEVAKTVKYNPILGDEFKEEYYEEQNLFLVRSNTYENDIEKSQKKYKYDSYGNIIEERTKVNDTGEEIVQTNVYDYSPNGELTITSTVKDVNQPDGSVNDIITIQKFDFLGNLVYVKDGNGGEWKYEYDMLGRVTKKINPLNKFESYFYDTVNNEVIVSFEFNDGDTETRYYKYDQLGNLSNVAYEDEKDSVTELAKFEYDELNRLTKEIEFVDEQTQNTAVYSYDAKNRIMSSVISGSNENGKEYQRYSYEYTDYDPSAEEEGVRTVTKIPEDSNYAAVKSYYDIESGNLLRETALSRKNNSVLYGAKYEYDYVDNAIKVQSGKDYGTNKYTALTTYDYANQVLTQTNSEGKTLQSKYDMAGRIVSNTNYLGNTTEYEYDALGQVIEQKVPFEDSVQVSTKNYYDGNGNVVKVETETGEPGAIEKKYNITENIYNPDNTLQKAVQYNGNEVLETSYEYYNNGQVKQMKIGSDDPEITSYEYDPLNNVKKITDSMGLVTNIVPDRTGNVKQVTDKNGTKTTYEYTALGSLKQSKAEKDGKQEELSYTYDSSGNVVSMTDQTGTTEYKYDEMGRLSEETKGSIEKSYTYTTDGLVKTFKLTNNGKTEQNAEYSYDSLNRLENVSDKTNSAMSASYTYYDDGNIKSESKGGKVTAAYTYNKAGLLTDMTDGGETYIYDHYADGNIKLVKENGEKKSEYVYNGYGMLISDITEGKTTTYGYDEYGNRINKSSETQTTRYSYDKNNRMLSEETTSGAEKEIISYTYDPNGNQLYKVKNTETEHIGEPELGIKLIEESDSGVEKYEYNLYNQLTKAVINGKISTYTYDGNGLRQSKTVNGETSSQIWNGGNVVMETNGSGESIANYYYGNKLYGAKTSGKNVYYSYNGHGDTRKLIDTSGATVANYDYDAFGNQTSATESIYNPFRYNGQYTDEETDLIYLRNRYYDPQVGRFITEDPAMDGYNWYIYCINNSVNFADPLGLDVWYFTGPDQVELSEADKKYLEDFYGVPVHVITVSTKEDFINEWNWIGCWDGEQVNVECIVINMHGSSNSIDPVSSGAESIDVSELKGKKADDILLLTCSGGDTSNKNNTAYKLLYQNEVNSVIASDETVYWDWSKQSDGQTSIKYYGQDPNYKGFIKYTSNDSRGADYSELGKSFVSSTDILTASPGVKNVLRQNDLED